MQWFRNLKIATKLLSSFSVVIVLTTILGVFSILELAKVNDVSSEIETNCLPSSLAVDEIALQFNQLRRL